MNIDINLDDADYEQLLAIQSQRLNAELAPSSAIDKILAAKPVKLTIGQELLSGYIVRAIEGLGWNAEVFTQYGEFGTVWHDEYSYGTLFTLADGTKAVLDDPKI